MSDLKACVLQRGLTSKVRLCAKAVKEVTARGAPESQREKRSHAKDLSAIVLALEEISNLQDAHAPHAKGAGSSKYVAARHAAADKWTTQEEHELLPTSACDQVRSWLQDAKRKVDESELPTPRAKRVKGGKENRSPRNGGQKAVCAPGHDEIMEQLLSWDPGIKLTIRQAVNRLQHIPPGKDRNHVMRSWSLDEGSGIVMMNRRGLQKRMKKIDAAALTVACKVRGQKGKEPLATQEEVHQWVDAHQTGQTFGREDVRQWLEAKTGRHVHDRTVRNYFSMAVVESETTSAAAKHKQPHRDAAERSLRRVQALAVNVLGSHILPGPSAVPATLNKNHDAVKAVSEAYGGIEVHAVDGAMIFNTDDTSLLIHTGSASKTEIRGVPHKGDQVHFASYKLNNADPATTMAVHMTLIASADGLSGPVVIRAKVKEREWVGAHGDNFIVFAVPGLARGADTNPNCTDVGYVVLMRNTGAKDSECVEKAYFRWYNSTIAIPFMDSCRARRWPTWKKGDVILAGMEGVSWTDGGGPQLRATVEDDHVQALQDRCVEAMKSNPSATAVEQEWDISPCFRLDKLYVKILNTSTYSSHQKMKAVVKAILTSEDAKKSVYLQSGRLEALAEFCGKMPFVLSKAHTPQHIVGAFKRSGKIDESGLPNVAQMWATRTQHSSPHEVQLLQNTLIPFLKLQFQHGMVPESAFDQENYPVC